MGPDRILTPCSFVLWAVACRGRFRSALGAEHADEWHPSLVLGGAEAQRAVHARSRVGVLIVTTCYALAGPRGRGALPSGVVHGCIFRFTRRVRLQP